MELRGGTLNTQSVPSSRMRLPLGAGTGRCWGTHPATPAPTSAALLDVTQGMALLWSTVPLQCHPRRWCHFVTLNCTSLEERQWDKAVPGSVPEKAIFFLKKPFCFRSVSIVVFENQSQSTPQCKTFFDSPTPLPPLPRSHCSIHRPGMCFRVF